MARNGERLVLGFDESCIECSALASELEGEIGEDVAIISLRSPRMREWREDALGEDAPWAPTLVRVGHGSVEAWVGWQIAPVLSRRLGPQRTWRVLRVLGGSTLSGRQTSPALPANAIKRSTFLRGAAGAVVGLGVLAQAGGAAAATTSRNRSGPAPEDIRTLRGSELEGAAMRHLAGKDVANTADSRSFGSAAAGAASVTAVPRSALRQSSTKTGEAAAPNNELEVYGAEITHPGGVRETSLVFYQHQQSMVLHSQELSEPVHGVASRAQRLHVEHGTADGPRLKTLSTSINGAVPKPVPETDVRTLASDPCGGCTSPRTGEELKDNARGCNWEYDFRCLTKAGRCGACAVAGGWFAAIACVFTTCPGAFAECCPSTQIGCVQCASVT